MIDNLLRNLRYALRTLTRTLGFTLMAVLTLALGIGAHSAVFSAVGATLTSAPQERGASKTTDTHSSATESEGGCDE